VIVISCAELTWGRGAYFAVPSAMVGFVIRGWLTVKIYMGRNWARITLLVLALLGLIAFPVNAPSSEWFHYATRRVRRQTKHAPSLKTAARPRRCMRRDKAV
jgi:hypothetical protein